MHMCMYIHIDMYIYIYIYIYINLLALALQGGAIQGPVDGGGHRQSLSPSDRKASQSISIISIILDGHY